MLKMQATRTRFGDMRQAVKKTVKQSNLEIGVAIAGQAKALAPVDEGQLRNSLSASSLTETRLLNDSSGEQAQALDTSGLSGDDVFTGSNSDHAIFPEYGTIKMVAQPFLRPSVEMVVDRKTPADIFSKYSAKEMEEELKKRKEEKWTST